LFVPPDPGSPGSLGANVTIVPGPGGSPSPPVQDVPEPTGLVLAGLGLSALGLRRWWARQRQAWPPPKGGARGGHAPPSGAHPCHLAVALLSQERLRPGRPTGRPSGATIPG